jgi:purine-binding chemotaxis protein CheW
MNSINAPDARSTTADTLSMCSLEAGGQTFGIDTRCIREVLGPRTVQAVPLSPAWVGGIVSYRGEVLTTVNLCALLDRAVARACSCVLVLDGEGDRQCFGLMVDDVGGVVTVRRDQFATNPSTLNARSHALFAGAFQQPSGLLVQLDPESLRPGRIVGSGLFDAAPDAWNRLQTEPPRETR